MKLPLVKSPLILAVSIFLTPPSFASLTSPDKIHKKAEVIDSKLAAGLALRDLSPNGIVNDATFLRRSYLNIIGRLPTDIEARSFLKSESKEKRSNLIDHLVNSPGLDSRLFNFWSDLLRLHTTRENHGLGWHVWLRKAVNQNMPYHEMVHAMLAAEGHVADNPAVGYYLRDRGMLLDNVSNTVQVFHGQQIGCAQCHDHPFDDVTQMDYYQLASFMGGTQYNFKAGRERVREVTGQEAEVDMSMSGKKKGKRKKLKQQAKKKQRAAAKDLNSLFRYHNRNALWDNPKKEIRLPDDYKYEDGKAGDVVTPRSLFAKQDSEVPPEKRRKFFADWATSPEHKMFTKVIANRLWEYVFGYGLVADPHDWGNSPKPKDPELVAHLEKLMKDSGYDVKEFLRILYHTRLFQQKANDQGPAQGFAYEFTGPVLRRMDAEEIRDSFITMHSGNIDQNSNENLVDSWQTYADSFAYLMNASGEELKELDLYADDAEEKRTAMQKQVSKLRSLVKIAKDAGEDQKVKKLNQQIKKLRKNHNRASDEDPSMMTSSVAKGKAAALRRTPRLKPSLKPEKLRSSELPSPQRGGSIVAEFGGSDRNSPSSAHTHATVPQILRLLNGRETALLGSKQSALAKSFRKMKTPEERLEFLFLNFYSAYPTAAEKEIFLPETKTPHSTLTLARAMLTSNRFLFVQ